VKLQTSPRRGQRNGRKESPEQKTSCRASLENRHSRGVKKPLATGTTVNATDAKKALNKKHRGELGLKTIIVVA